MWWNFMSIRARTNASKTPSNLFIVIYKMYHGEGMSKWREIMKIQYGYQNLGFEAWNLKNIFSHLKYASVTILIASRHAENQDVFGHWSKIWFHFYATYTRLSWQWRRNSGNFRLKRGRPWIISKFSIFPNWIQFLFILARKFERISNLLSRTGIINSE